MATSSLLPEGRQRYYNNDGTPCAGGKVYTYAAGTSTPKTTYSDADGTIPNANPVPLDVHGEAILFWSGAYKVDVKQADGQQVSGYPVDNLRSDPVGVGQLSSKDGSNGVGFVQAGVGARTRTVQDRLRDTVHLSDYTPDDTGAANNANVLAFEAAAALGLEIIVKPPAIAYYLATSPTFPKNVNIDASPSWFTGPGTLPFHRFIAKSEGVDPRVFQTRGMKYTESAPNRTTRMFVACGWVDITDAPAAGYAGTLTDAVGVDGRARVSAPDGRGWAVVGLGQLDPGSSGQAQVYAAEFDVNNNLAHCTSDSNPIALGVATVSGGTFRPRHAHFINATRTPTNGLGDNRWNFGLSFYTDSCYEANIYIYDGNGCDAMRIPSTSRGVHWTGNANLDNFYARINPSTFRLEFTVSPNRYIDVLNNAGQKVVSFGESSTELGKPLGYSGGTLFSLPASVDCDTGDVFVFGAAGTITGGLTGALGVSRIITLINASGGVVNITPNANMRTVGHAAVVLQNVSVVQFAFQGGTYFQIAAPVVNG